jgi:hypothetical protein
MKTLPPKYQKALALISTGSLTLGEVAKQAGLADKTLYNLVEGADVHKSESGRLFFEEYKKIEKDRDREIRNLIKGNKKKVHQIISKWLEANQNKPKVDKSLMSTAVSVANVLAKSTPNVEIGSFSYTKGLSAEDLFSEFKRLKGLAEVGVNRSRVSGVAEGGAGESGLAEGAGDTAAEEPENPLLRGESEA